MRDTHSREIEYYYTPNGQRPFIEWLESIQDIRTQDRIQARVDRLKFGNFGDYRSVGDGVYELHFNFGPGYRIYFGQVAQLFFCSVVVTSHHKHATLNVRKPIGCNTRRHTNAKNGKMA